MITIDSEFQSLIPSLSAEEYGQLEENILHDGIRDALIVWNGVLLDGHNRYKIAQKRYTTPMNVIDEYWECIPNGDTPIEDEFILKRAINGFLMSLDTKTRVIFMRRYWYSMSVKDVADSMRLSESNVSVILHRTRQKFKDYLMKEGIFI